MLKCETNTPAIARLVLNAAVDTLHGGDFSMGPEHFQVDFEHGQWWVTNLHTGEQYAVVDADGPGTYNGLAFEQVTEGDEP